MDADDCRHLLAYEDWANHEVLNALRSSAAPPPKAVNLLAHIAAARTLWLDRLRGRSDSVEVFPEWGLDEIADRLDRLATEWAGVLDDADGVLDRPVSYRNQRGEPYRNTVREILIHLALHGPYHRGQIAALLGAVGETPPPTDFILAVRRGLLP